jgi:hypothetical protein
MNLAISGKSQRYVYDCFGFMARWKDQWNNRWLTIKRRHAGHCRPAAEYLTYLVDVAGGAALLFELSLFCKPAKLAIAIGS